MTVTHHVGLLVAYLGAMLAWLVLRSRKDSFGVPGPTQCLCRPGARWLGPSLPWPPSLASESYTRMVCSCPRPAAIDRPWTRSINFSSIARFFYCLSCAAKDWIPVGTDTEHTLPGRRRCCTRLPRALPLCVSPDGAGDLAGACCSHLPAAACIVPGAGVARLATVIASGGGRDVSSIACPYDTNEPCVSASGQSREPEPRLRTLRPRRFMRHLTNVAADKHFICFQQNLNIRQTNE